MPFPFPFPFLFHLDRVVGRRHRTAIVDLTFFNAFHSLKDRSNGLIRMNRIGKYDRHNWIHAHIIIGTISNNKIHSMWPSRCWCLEAHAIPLLASDKKIFVQFVERIGNQSATRTTRERKKGGGIWSHVRSGTAIGRGWKGGAGNAAVT